MTETQSWTTCNCKKNTIFTMKNLKNTVFKAILKKQMYTSTYIDLSCSHKISWLTRAWERSCCEYYQLYSRIFPSWIVLKHIGVFPNFPNNIYWQHSDKAFSSHFHKQRKKIYECVQYIPSLVVWVELLISVVSYLWFFKGSIWAIILNY